VPEATLRPTTQLARPKAVRRTSSAASQAPQHDSYARQIEPRGDVTGNKQKGETRVERSFTLGEEAK